jgi:hypothetical protein
VQTIPKSPKVWRFDYDPENWMARVSFAKMWQLVLPASHDSFAYKFKNHIPPIIKNFVQTQNLTITE